MKILVINGPNMNMLGRREPEIYGTQTYDDLMKMVQEAAAREGVEVDFFQSNHEGDIVDRIQAAAGVMAAWAGPFRWAASGNGAPCSRAFWNPASCSPVSGNPASWNPASCNPASCNPASCSPASGPGADKGPELNSFTADAIIINPAAYSHTSIAILDALNGAAIPTVEVHISDISSREEFRRTSLISPACLCTIAGHGLAGYCEAVAFLAARLTKTDPGL